jgi:NAD(P)-dependent dehydrogenase (short-subunit alcohol dehydrogenase family)
MTDRRSAIVVGGAGGLGSAICRRLAADGYRIAAADLNLEGAQDVVGSLPGDGHQAVRLDVTSDAEIDAVFDAVEARYPISVLVVTSGGLVSDPRTRSSFSAMTTPDWRRTIAYNLDGMFFCMRKFAQLRLANPLPDGRIITMASGAGQFAGTPTDMGYVASKAAVIGMTRQAALELARVGVTVNTIAPGPIGTPEFNRNTTEQIRAAAAGVTVVNRLGTPEEIARGVSFLASPDQSYVTGTTLDINGGSHMH